MFGLFGGLRVIAERGAVVFTGVSFAVTIFGLVVEPDRFAFAFATVFFAVVFAFGFAVAAFALGFAFATVFFAVEPAVRVDFFALEPAVRVFLVIFFAMILTSLHPCFTALYRAGFYAIFTL
jgi:hypothetical protein